MSELRLPAETKYAAELAALEANDSGARPPQWKLSPRAVETYAPFKPRLDESAGHLAVGAWWTDAFVETHVPADGGAPREATVAERWVVEAMDETVTVPAGTFACMRIRRNVDGDSTAGKVYWFAAGVGKVLERGGQTEELVAYSTP